MNIKIYFNDKPLFLCDLPNEEIKGYQQRENTLFMDQFSPEAISSIIAQMHEEKVKAGIFVHSDFGALRREFYKNFVMIQAGGGLVQNEKSETLFMFRRDKWDLPKGKLDKGETLEECAVREVGEETGLKDIRLEQQLIITYHTYEEGGKPHLKETYWYRMRVFGNQQMWPQQSEQITELKWLARNDLGAVLGNTYPSIIDVIRAGGFVSAAVLK